MSSFSLFNLFFSFLLETLKTAPFFGENKIIINFRKHGIYYVNRYLQGNIVEVEFKSLLFLGDSVPFLMTPFLCCAISLTLFQRADPSRSGELDFPNFGSCFGTFFFFAFFFRSYKRMSNEPWQEMQELGINSNKIFELMVSYFNLKHFTTRIVFSVFFHARKSPRREVHLPLGVRPSDLRGACKGMVKCLHLSQVV